MHSNDVSTIINIELMYSWCINARIKWIHGAANAITPKWRKRGNLPNGLPKFQML